MSNSSLPTITLGTPIAQAAIAQYVIIGVIIDFSSGIMTLRMQALDADSNPLGGELLYSVGSAVATARIATLGPQVASDYATDSGE